MTIKDITIISERVDLAKKHRYRVSYDGHEYQLKFNSDVKENDEKAFLAKIQKAHDSRVYNNSDEAKLKRVQEELDELNEKKTELEAQKTELSK